MNPSLERVKVCDSSLPSLFYAGIHTLFLFFIFSFSIRSGATVPLTLLSGIFSPFFDLKSFCSVRKFKFICMTRRLTEYGLVQAELRHQAVKKIVQIGIQWHWLRMRNQKKREVRSYYGVCTDIGSAIPCRKKNL